jgi:hypothetical protein
MRKPVTEKSCLDSCNRESVYSGKMVPSFDKPLNGCRVDPRALAPTEYYSPEERVDSDKYMNIQFGTFNQIYIPPQISLSRLFRATNLSEVKKILFPLQAPLVPHRHGSPVG